MNTLFLTYSTIVLALPVPVPSGAVGLIFFVMYVIFGPGNVLFQIAALIRYFVFDKTSVDPEAVIQWPTDPREIKFYLGFGILVTLAPFAYALIMD